MGFRSLLSMFSSDLAIDLGTEANAIKKGRELFLWA